MDMKIVVRKSREFRGCCEGNV